MDAVRKTSPKEHREGKGGRGGYNLKRLMGRTTKIATRGERSSLLPCNGASANFVLIHIASQFTRSGWDGIADHPGSAFLMLYLPTHCSPRARAGVVANGPIKWRDGWRFPARPYAGTTRVMEGVGNGQGREKFALQPFRSAPTLNI